MEVACQAEGACLAEVACQADVACQAQAACQAQSKVPVKPTKTKRSPVKRRPAPKSPVKQRFLDAGNAAVHRRQKREWARKRDRAGEEDSRPGSRHAGNLCCFKRPHRCKCDYQLVEASVCQSRLSEFLGDIWNAQLQTILDTVDCGPFLSAYRGCKMSPVWT